MSPYETRARMQKVLKLLSAVPQIDDKIAETADSFAAMGAGFPPELVFGYYEPSDKRRWSAEISADEQLWTVLYLVARSLGGIKAREWGRRTK